MTREDKIIAMQQRKKEFDGKFYNCSKNNWHCMSAKLSRAAAS